MKKIDIMIMREETKSIILNTSPVMTNRPFINNRPEQNKVYCKNGLMLNISIRKANADKISKRPNIFTNTILFFSYEIVFND